MIALHLDAPSLAQLTSSLSPRIVALSTYAQSVASGTVDPLQAVADDVVTLSTLDQYRAQLATFDVSDEAPTRQGVAA